MDTLKISAWISNGLQPRALKDAWKYHITIYDTKHPSGKAQAVIIRNDIKRYLHSQISLENVQATTVTIQTNSNYFQMSAVYVPPRHEMTQHKLVQYFQSLGDKYIAMQSTHYVAQDLTHIQVEH